MVNATCAVRDCYSSSRIHKDRRFHQFPHTEERCMAWVRACGRPDLFTRTMESLRNTYICNLHFEKRLYGKRTLKKTAIPTLLLPINSIQTQTDSTDYISNEVELNHPQQSQMEIQETQKPIIVSTCSLAPNAENTPTEKCIDPNQSSQTPALTTNPKNVTMKQFLKGCDEFLSPMLSAVVKAQICLRPHFKNNRYSREYKLFCISMYNTSPLTYRFLSKTVYLPPKSSLASIYLPMTTKHNELMWDALSATIKHMSSSEKQCVLCMDEMRLKLNLHYNSKEDNMLGLHDVDGQQQLLAPRYAFTLVLRGIASKWTQPVGFSFISRNKVDSQLKTWIINTVKRLLELGLNLRAVVSDPSFPFITFSKTLGISKKNSYFKINGFKIYYIFDMPYLIKCIRNIFMQYNFEFDGKTAQWEDILHMYIYELDKPRDMRFAPRLTNAHLHPTSIQKPIVRFAAQVLSNSVAVALRNYKLSGTLQIADGTIRFVETINKLFDLLNSGDVNSPNSYNMPYSGTTAQVALLDSTQHLLNNIQVKNKGNVRDDTKPIEVLNTLYVNINSVRQLFADMNSEGYKSILTQRLNNEPSKKFAELVRQASGNCRKPTCLQYTRAFRKHFLCQMLNLSDATNHTEDFDNMLTQFVKFGKNTPPAPVADSGQSLGELQEDFVKMKDLPEKNAFQYVCGYLFRKCVESHKRDCLSVVHCAWSYGEQTHEKNVYVGIGAGDTDCDVAAGSQDPPVYFEEHIHKLEIEFISIFASYVGLNIGHKLFQRLSSIEFESKPCACFPEDFLLKLFIRMRIFYFVKFNNMKLKFNKSTDLIYLSISQLV